MAAKIRNALITGGSSGIGLALAKALTLEGVNVCILARDENKLDQAKEELLKLKVCDSQHIETISCDVTEYDILDEKLKQWVKGHALPDLVVNSAGVTYPGYFQELDVDIFHWLMNVNYFGTLHVVKSLTPGFIERGSGLIVNICSQAAFTGVFGYSGYSASKYAVRGFSDVIRSELKAFGIRVFLVFPPDTQTPQLEFEKPLQPFETKALNSVSKAMSAEQVASAILKGIHRGKYIIIPGIDGKIIYRLLNFFGMQSYHIIDWLIRNIQKKKNNI